MVASGIPNRFFEANCQLNATEGTSEMPSRARVRAAMRTQYSGTPAISRAGWFRRTRSSEIRRPPIAAGQCVQGLTLSALDWSSVSRTTNSRRSRNEPDYLHPTNAETYGSNGVLMVSSNDSTAPSGDTQYEVVSISDPASPKPLATIPAVIQRLDREQTGTIFLLTDSGLTVVRCLAAEREYQIEAQ